MRLVENLVIEVDLQGFLRVLETRLNWGFKRVRLNVKRGSIEGAIEVRCAAKTNGFQFDFHWKTFQLSLENGVRWGWVCCKDQWGLWGRRL